MGCETDVYKNYFHGLWDDAISADGYTANLRIFHNRITRTLADISLAPADIGPVYIVRNVVQDFGVAPGAAYYSGASIKLNTSGERAYGPIFILHNTFWSNAGAPYKAANGWFIKSPGKWTLVKSRNNVFRGSSYSVHNTNITQPIDMDYDCLDSKIPGNLVNWGGREGRFTRLQEFHIKTGQEKHGVAANPRFVATNTGNLLPSLKSPLIDAGERLPGINDDFKGKAPDIGAFELGLPRWDRVADFPKAKKR